MPDSHSSVSSTPHEKRRPHDPQRSPRHDLIPRLDRAQDAADAFYFSLWGADSADLKDLTRTAEAAGLPPIHVSPLYGRLLRLLIRMSGARRVPEVGTLAGYSAH